MDKIDLDFVNNGNAIRSMNKYTEVPVVANCAHCGKGYKTKACHDKHAVICKIIHSPTTTINEDTDFIPSPKLMYKLIVDLTQKYSRLETKMNEMHKWNSQQKRRFDVVDWLSKNVAPEYAFDELVDLVTINQDDILFMFNNNIYNTLSLILSRSVFVQDPKPIFAFAHKIGVLYIYNRDKTWSEIPKDKLVRFFNIIQQKLSRGLSLWSKTHKDELNTSDSISLMYDKTVAKLFGIDFAKDQCYNKVRLMVYANIKFDVALNLCNI